MPRSSKVDAVEKFRFSVFVLNIGFDPVSLASTFTGFLRGGFSEVVLPKRTTSSIEYRENTDPLHPQYGVGLTRYEPVALRRGVTTSSDFFRWAQKVHDSGSVISTGLMSGRSDPSQTMPKESQNFRRDVIIVVYGRGGGVPTGGASAIPGLNKVANVAGAAGLSVLGVGDVSKAILLRDAWVSSFSPGDTLSSKNDSEKLIEELELKYESFEELTPEALLNQLGDLVGAAGGALSTVLQGGSLF